MNDETICPLCGQHHFEENDDFEECPVCGWVNDGVQRADPDYRGGYNRIPRGFPWFRSTRAAV